MSKPQQPAPPQKPPQQPAAPPRMSFAQVSGLGPFRYRKFDEENLPAALEAIIYGTSARIYNVQRKKMCKAIAFLHDEDPRFLQILVRSRKLGDSMERVDLLNLKRADDVPANPLTVDNPKQVPHPHQVLGIVTNNNQEIVFAFASVQEKKNFWQGLEEFVKLANKRMKSMNIFDLAQELWVEADVDGNKKLSLNEVDRIFTLMNFHMEKAFLEKQFRTFDKDNSGTIDFQEFSMMIRFLLTKTELKGLFKKYTNGAYADNAEDDKEDAKAIMSLEQLKTFWTQEQKSTNFPLQEIFNLLKKTNATGGQHLGLSQRETQVTMNANVNPNGGMAAVGMKGSVRTININPAAPIVSFYDFIAVIFSHLNSIFDPDKEKVHQENTWPLTDYWINSSHNTYLMGDQLVGDSSLEAYIRAVEIGCRCVELDCWDGDKGEPIVYHGYTMTSKLLFEEIAHTLNDHAFAFTDHPLILSLEMHCGLDQQAKVAGILRRVFGGKLWLVRQEHQKLELWPTLENLKNKVIVKSTGSLKNRELWEDFDEYDEMAFVVAEENTPVHRDVEVKNKKIQEMFDRATKLNIRIDQSFYKPETVGQRAVTDIDYGGRYNNVNLMQQQPMVKSNSKKGLKPITIDVDIANKSFDQTNNRANAKTPDLPLTDASGNQMRAPGQQQPAQAHQNRYDQVYQPNQQQPAPYPTALPAHQNRYDQAYQAPQQQYQQSYPQQMQPQYQVNSQAGFYPPQPQQPQYPVATNTGTYYPPKQQQPPQYPVANMQSGGNQPGQVTVVGQSPLKTGPSAGKSPEKGAKPKKVETHPELESIMSMFSEKFAITGLGSVWGISSLDEDKVLTIGKKDEGPLVDFNRRFFTRIYPGGTRIGSSNYDPVRAWAFGSQIVALNFQTKDDAMLLNWARFKENGGKHGGCVLKPAYMRSGAKPLRVPSSFDREMKRLTVTIISGSQLKLEQAAGAERNKDILDPYVEISIKGLPVDQQTYTSKIIDNNGLNPQWNEMFTFRVCAPDFAFLRFVVFDKNTMSSQKVAWYAVPFNCLRPGFRMVPLLNKQLTNIPYSNLFVHVKIDSV